MNNHILPKFLITLIAILCVLGSGETLFAQGAKVNPAAQENSDGLQLQARQYREAGLEKQRVGDLAEAMSLYQKAIIVDPGYAVAYNDLGVIYEAMDSPQRAEQSYLKSLKINPAYLSAYTNLALFYEKQHNLDKALFYWGKRAQIGYPDDPWTQKAASRFKDIRMSKQPVILQREGMVPESVKDAVAKTAGVVKPVVDNEDDKAVAQVHFQKAKDNFKSGDLLMAIKEALVAYNLDPHNPEIEAFIEKAQLRALSR